MMITLLMVATCNVGCIDNTNESPTPIIKTSDTVRLNEVKTTLRGSVTGDSILATLWTIDTIDDEHVKIENPDSLITDVWFNKRGEYVFTFWVQDKNGLMDSAQLKVTVN